jgi:hypothetical protein
MGTRCAPATHGVANSPDRLGETNSFTLENLPWGDIQSGNLLNQLFGKFSAKISGQAPLFQNANTG